jgi:hypothetical protein
MIPRERSLVEKHEDEPFAIVGVNSDEEREKIAAVRGRQGIRRRSASSMPRA